MNKTMSQLVSANSRMHKAAMLKVFSPGIVKFLVRFFQRIKKTGSIKKVKLFFGDEMLVVLPEIVSEAIYTYGMFDDIVTGFIVSNLRKGEVVLDIGAHFGYFTLLSSCLVGDEGTVYSFEPSPSTFEILSMNTLQKRNVFAINAAVGRENGKCEIVDYGLKYCAWNTLSDNPRMENLLKFCSKDYSQVELVRLDTFLSKNNVVPTFVKVDAENYEYDVVAGFEKTLCNHRPKIIIEAGSSSSLRAAELLLNHGYRVYVSQKLGEISEWNGPIEKANAIYKDILFVPSGRN
jgi:FkbM family methyltransferase